MLARTLGKHWPFPAFSVSSVVFRTKVRAGEMAPVSATAFLLGLSVNFAIDHHGSDEVKRGLFSVFRFSVFLRLKERHCHESVQT